jgi:uncharacterized protein YciI
MNFVVIGKDKGAGEYRARHRAAHLDYIAERQEPIIYAGPLIEGERMIGSLFVFDMPNRAALDEHLAQDPYFSEGIFETVEIYESRWMVPEREPGFLRAEAAKARAA